MAAGNGVAASAEALAGPALVEALRGGGYTIYFRHAATDWRNHDRVAKAGDWISCDPNRMRQLSDEGRETARRIGQAFRALAIPVGRVLSSEYCRAVETARLMGLGEVETTRDIMNMRAAELVGGREAVIRRAQDVFSRTPPPGTNVVIVGHGNLMRAATQAYAAEGGSGIYAAMPGSDPGFQLIARLSPDDWMNLAAEASPGGGGP
ncbi:MAG: histidine phosphatase family protein [Kiloniellales bacterium]|nr:histidine phosphatase family protein [Kiloniellales bacterium]